jgi:hypothetical protein
VDADTTVAVDDAMREVHHWHDGCVRCSSCQCQRCSSSRLSVFAVVSVLLDDPIAAHERFQSRSTHQWPKSPSSELRLYSIQRLHFAEPILSRKTNSKLLSYENDDSPVVASF